MTVDDDISTERVAAGLVSSKIGAHDTAHEGVEDGIGMRICIIGGTGHISTSLVTLLLTQGHEVTCVTRGRSGEVPEGARWIQGDRQDRAAFERTMQATPFDAAIDMQCFTREDAASSVRAFPHVQHFVQCSTVCTYGIAHDWRPVTEDHPLRPTTAYGQHKAEADTRLLGGLRPTGLPRHHRQAVHDLWPQARPAAPDRLGCFLD